MNELVVSDESIIDSTNADDRIVSKSLPNESKRRLSSNVFSDVISNRLMDTSDDRIDHRNSPNRRRVNSSDSLNKSTHDETSSKRRFTRNGNSNNSIDSLNRSLHETTNSRKKRGRQGLDESVHSSVTDNDSVDETDNPKSGIAGSLKGSQKESLRRSEDEDERLMNSRLAFKC